MLLLYCLTAAVSFLAFFLAYHVWRADLHVPFSYVWYGDAIEPQFKQLVDGGWFFEPRLSAPFGQHSIGIAQLNGLKWGIRWLFAAITHNPFMAQDLFELIDPVLSSVTFLYAATRLGLSYAAAIPCAVLFANLYMLYWRVLASHSLQAAYWMTPLGCLVLLWIARGMSVTEEEDRRFRLSRDGIVLLIIAVLIGFESHYEVFFASSLALVAMLIGCLQTRSLRPILTGLVFIGIMAFSFLIDYSPTLFWKLSHHGAGYQYARLPVEAYLYSLSIGQMILPNPDHRIHALASMRDHFDSVFPILSNENKSATLGVVGTIGLSSLVLALIARGVWKVPRVVEHSALLALAAIVLATTGSVGAIVNTFITPYIRAYNRISTWISFFCLLAVAYMLDALWRELRKRRRGTVYFGFAAFLTILGVLDQSPAHCPPYAASRQQFVVDQSWVQRVVATVPKNGAVLELPYVDDLESLEGTQEQIPFMLSDDVRFSAGAFRGSREAGFEKWLASLPPRHMVAVALLCGFDGILVFHQGFADNGAAAIAGLREVTGIEPIVREDGTQSYFAMPMLAEVAKTVDAAVGEPEGVAEALGIYDRNAADSSRSLRRIERAVTKRSSAARNRAAELSAEGLKL